MRSLALECGVDVVGWAVARVPKSAVEQYARWLAKGHHAGMSYLERQLPVRADPTQRLAGAASVLVLGISHAFAPPERPAGGLRVGRVARYAWTPDYHDQIQPILTRLEEEAKRLGIAAKGYVDHGPVMERLFAAQGFLGWQGKSGMLINMKLGAFVTLAVLLTDLPLPHLPLPHLAMSELSEPESLELRTYPTHPDRCGRCTRCLDICPTQALGPDRTLDARRCLSYLTIEHRGPLPLEFRRQVGSWLFGCDLCSEICPWTQKAGPLARLFVPRPEWVYPDLNLFFGVSERQFARQFAGSAFLRARRKGMARNALTVLGNTKEAAGWPLLLAAREDQAWEVREAAVWALGEWDEARHVVPLENDPNEAVRESVRRVLAASTA